MKYFHFRNVLFIIAYLKENSGYKQHCCFRQLEVYICSTVTLEHQIHLCVTFLMANDHGNKILSY